MSTTTPEVLQQLDAQYHLHPFTNHDELHAMGTHILERGDGVFLYDAKGRKLLDGLAGLWCVNVGYNCSEIADAVAEQMRRLPYYPSFFNSTTEPAIRLAEKLAALAPARLKHTIFSNSGSEANETALKLIRAYHKLRGRQGKTKIITREFAYHWRDARDDEHDRAARLLSAVRSAAARIHPRAGSECRMRPTRRSIVMPTGDGASRKRSVSSCARNPRPSRRFLPSRSRRGRRDCAAGRLSQGTARPRAQT
jgi:hypothetical protein